jgi:Zn-dependent peptidase ImmA (M78 family)/DNA-binding XRE family transcriptional regulator
MKEIFAQRLHAARKGAGLSLQKLSEFMGGKISKQAINKYEKGLALPDSKNLIALAEALNVRVDYFFRPVRQSVELSEPVYRKKSNLPQKKLDYIRHRTREMVERYLEIENQFEPDRFVKFKLPDNKLRQVNNAEDIEKLAESVRKEWDLGFDSIPNLIEMLEDRNVIVIEIEADVEFDGLSCWANNEIPVIVIRKTDVGDRQRSNIAHELGHLLMITGNNIDEEKAAKRFSAAFLVPRESVYIELGHKKSTLTLRELERLKIKYGMSMQQWIYRAKDLGIITESYAKKLFMMFRKKGWAKEEPGLKVQAERPQRMKQLCLELLEQDMSSEAKIAELLETDISTLRKELRATFDA